MKATNYLGQVLTQSSGGGGLTPHKATHQYGGTDYLNWSVVSPAALGASQNDWAPGNGDVVRTDASVNVDITGLAGGAAGYHRRIVNISAANTITLKHEDAGSSAANRFIGTGGADLVLFPNDQATVWYDSTTSRWRASLA